MKKPLWRRILARTLRMVVLGYVLICALTYFYQDKLLFPGAAFQNTPNTAIHYGAGAEIVTLKTKDGIDVAAAVHLEPTTRPTVLFFYGNGGSVAWSVNEFDQLRRRGLDVLVPDYPGFGVSGGKPTESNCYQTADAAYDYLTQARHVPPDQIVVVGWSLGGAVAIDLASRRPVAGVATFNTFTTAAEVGQRLLPWLPVRPLMKYKFDSISKMPLVHCPALIVNGSADTLVDPAMSDRLARAAAGPTSRLVIDGADHNSIFIQNPGVVFPKLQDFVRRVTKKPKE